MSENKGPLPVCKLCGQHPCEDNESDYVFCNTVGCTVYWKDFEPHEWRTLMAPPVVTDAMVERAWEHVVVVNDTLPLVTKHNMRAVLEAAMKE